MGGGGAGQGGREFLDMVIQRDGAVVEVRYML